MAAEAELKIKLMPELSGLDDLIGQLRRTGEALSGLADSLQRLSDGSPDAARTEPDTSSPGFDFSSIPQGTRQVDPTSAGICPWTVVAQGHDAHRFQIDMDTSKIGAPVLSFDCPGHPVRPWHGHTDRTP
jgi:hypothetical protein